MSRLLATALFIAALIGAAYATNGLWRDEAKPDAIPAQDEVEARESDHAEEGSTTQISSEAARSIGLATEVAGPSTIRRTLSLSGQVTLNKNRTADVKARFPGVVREVRRTTGDSVKAGDVLARVESNDSLQVYAVTSPIAGTVVSRSTNIGDVAGDEPLFTVADLSDLWVELHVFPRDLVAVGSGQDVIVSAFESDLRGDATLTRLLPVAEESSQTIVARATLPNPAGLWRPGMMVRGRIVIAERDVPVAVVSAALQRVEGDTVVFVQEGERYEARRVSTGDADGDRTEITEGLKVGELYVTDKSFQLKADIGKSNAAHDH